MDYLTRVLFFYKFTMLYLAVGCFSTCVVENTIDWCTYNISCKIRPVSLSLTNPTSCTDFNVTFVISSSTQATLTSGFFSVTNFDSRVKYIIAQNNFWHTIESHAFKYYLQTKMIYLRGNQIVDINNEPFSKLVKLITIDLSENNIKMLLQNSLYIESRNSLENLYLSSNQLTHLQDNLFSSLVNCDKLFLQNNKISWMSEDCFLNLNNLTILHLQNNNLKSFNTTLLHLKKLRYLDVSLNQIKEISNYEFSRLKALYFLNISYNALEFIEINSFEQVVNLKFLDLSHNKIHQTIESKMFMSNHDLEYLDLFDNKITSIKDLSFNFNTLDYFAIERNSLSMNISRDTLKGLNKIKNLNITQQDITGIEENSFIDMQNLQYLNLSRNNIRTVDNTSFQFQNKSVLTTLDISYNMLNELYFLEYFSSDLSEIYVNNNKLTILRKGTFDKHKKLMKLDVSENEIVRIEQYSLPLLNLHYLRINKNNISGDIKHNVFSPAPHISYLDISNSSIQRISEHAFDNLQLLTKLNLSNNAIEFIDSNNFMNMGHIWSLDLSNNELSDLQIINILDKLQVVNLSNNKLTRFPQLLSKTPNLSQIDVSNNYISDCKNAGFENILNITILKMSHNDIKMFNNDYTDRLSNLKELKLDSNKISEIKLSSFQKLENLDLHNNSFFYINNTWFLNLHLLKFLHLSENKINILSPGTFQHLQKLIFLNLSSNYLQNIRYGTFRGLNQIRFIDLSRNKISYLDVNVFYECTYLKKIIIDYNFIKTIDLETLIVVTPNVETISLGGNPISCKEVMRTFQQKESKRLEVTSIHKIFYEDNVHGIKCGNTSYSSSTEASQEKNVNNIAPTYDDRTGNSFATILLIWCTILTISALLIISYFYYRKRRRANTESRITPGVYQRSSLHISTEEDFLG